MDFTIDTGDSADSQQLNETLWVRTLLEGGALNPNSGVNKATYSHPLCPNLFVPGAAEAARYTGVQDYDDYVEGPTPSSTTPTRPKVPHAAWPKYPGLMDRGQQAVHAPAGLNVPSYVAFGNHDALVQGNAAANAAFEQVATGCLKPIGPVSNPENAAACSPRSQPGEPAGLAADQPAEHDRRPRRPEAPLRLQEPVQGRLQGRQRRPTATASTSSTPPRRRASKGAAGYYAWSPAPGMRFIALDTVAEAGTILTPTGKSTSDGNIDDPQFKWLRGQLQAATAADELVVAVQPPRDREPHRRRARRAGAALPAARLRTGTTSTPAATSTRATPADPPRGRRGQPPARIPQRDRLGRRPLARQHRHAFPNPGGPGGFWSIRVAAEADWPQQSRLLEVFDNHDGTLSIFGTILDHVGQAAAPAPGTAASAMDFNDLASAARTMSFNDLQSGAPQGEGQADDRNVELLIDDPR